MNKRTATMVTIFQIALVSMLFCACSGPLPTTLTSEVHVRSAALLAKGAKYYRKGDTGLAEQAFLQALRESSSIEDTYLMSASLLNLARLNRVNHNLKQAAVFINQALLLSSNATEPDAEIYFEKGMLELADNRLTSATEWAEKALKAENGVQIGTRLNLLGRIQKTSGNYRAALETVNRALRENRNVNADEEANSLLLLGQLNRFEHRLEQADTCLSAALEIFKRMGNGLKIGKTLEEMAETALAKNNPVYAKQLFERAMRVYENGNHGCETDAINLHLQELQLKQ